MGGCKLFITNEMLQIKTVAKRMIEGCALLEKA